LPFNQGGNLEENEGLFIDLWGDMLSIKSQKGRTKGKFKERGTLLLY
jgi:hypothetical protein